MIFQTLKKKWVLVSVLLISLFYFSQQLIIYNFLSLKFNVLDAYLLDQFTFILIFILLLVIGLRLGKIKFGYIDLLFFLVFSAIMLYFQSEQLYKYFIKDDFYIMFSRLNRPDLVNLAYLHKGDFFYYHFMPFTLLFKFYKYDAYYYNFWALALMGFSGMIMFKLLKYINKLYGFRNRLLTFLVVCLYLVSPTIMEGYLYFEHGSAIGYILGFVLLSIYFYLRLKEKNDNYYFLLVLVALLVLLKTAFVRSGFLPACLIFLELVNFSKTKKDLWNSLLRIVLIFIPFFITSKAYFVPSGVGRLYGISFDRFVNLDRIYLVFSALTTALVPTQILTPVYRSIVSMAKSNSLQNTYLFNNLFFLTGILLNFFVLLSVLVLRWKKKPVKLIIFFWFCSLVSMLFFMLFGNSDKGALFGSFDLGYILYAMVPGWRYNPWPLAFILITFYLIFSSFGANKKIYIVTIFLLVLVVGTDVYTTQSINRGLNPAMISFKTVTDKVLNLVPDNAEEKIVYSTKGELKNVRFLGHDGFADLYKNSAPSYLTNQEDLLSALTKKKIKKENFYAFYYDESSWDFKDQSDEFRLKYADYLD